MAEKLITTVRLQELHESVKYAQSHGNGQVSLAAAELLELLPELPEEHKQPSTRELLAKELQEKEAAQKPAVSMGTIAAIERTEAFAQELAAEPVAAEPVAKVAAPAGAPIVETVNLSQEEIDAQVKRDKEHPTQEEQERAKAVSAAVEVPPPNAPEIAGTGIAEAPAVEAPAIEPAPAPVTDAV